MNLPTIKRRHVHAAFATLAIALAAIATHDALQLRAASRLGHEIEAANQHADAVTQQLVEQSPEVALARAVALADANDYDSAALAYKRLTLSERADIRHVALYNLGNLHMREAGKEDVRPEKERAMVELAKQSYRDLLGQWPDDWAARYNLDRSLWNAPEQQDDDNAAAPPPVAQRPTADRPPLP
jgi:mxaK protein